MKKEYKNLMITDHDEMECEILGVARLKLKVGLVLVLGPKRVQRNSIRVIGETVPV